MRWLELLVAALALADVVSTRVLLERKGFHEGGVVWSRLELSPALLSVVQAACYLAGILALEWWAPPLPAVWIFPGVFLVYAVANNFAKLRRSRWSRK